MSVQDWRKPHVRAKNKVVGLARKGFQIVGRYQGYGTSAQATEQSDRVNFIGDIPRAAGTEPYQRRLNYVTPRPAVEAVKNLTYTPAGHSWMNGTLVERWSVRAPSVKEILQGEPKERAEPLKNAWLIEGQSPFTYGDWVGDHIRALVEADSSIGPVVLPAFLAEKAYVKRDLARLGLELVAADRPLHIENAHILRKQVPSYYWGQKQVDAYRERLKVKLVTPNKGSLLYLSRTDVVSEAVDRTYPSAIIAGVVRDLGGEVFDTRSASPEAFQEIAMKTETIIADQGSAIFGVLQWQTKNLIEVTTEEWWHSANLFFAVASGVENYAILVCDRYRDDEIPTRLTKMLEETGFQAKY